MPTADRHNRGKKMKKSLKTFGMTMVVVAVLSLAAPPTAIAEPGRGNAKLLVIACKVAVAAGGDFTVGQCVSYWRNIFKP